MKRTLFVRGAAVAAVGLIVLAAYGAVQELSVKRKPKVGDSAEYKVSAEFDTGQGSVTLGQKRVEKVAEVNADGGFVVEASTSETKISFGGQDLPAQPDVLVKMEFGPDGVIKNFTSEKAVDASAYRISHLHAFKAPDGAVKVGDEIKFEIPADSKLDTPDVKSVFKVVASEKVKDWDTVKLTFSSAESGPGTSSSINGTVWVSTADGSVVKSEEEWKDVQPSGAPFPLSGKYKAERVK